MPLQRFPNKGEKPNGTYCNRIPVHVAATRIAITNRGGDTGRMMAWEGVGGQKDSRPTRWCASSRWGVALGALLWPTLRAHGPKVATSRRRSQGPICRPWSSIVSSRVSSQGGGNGANKCAQRTGAEPLPHAEAVPRACSAGRAQVLLEGPWCMASILADQCYRSRLYLCLCMHLPLPHSAWRRDGSTERGRFAQSTM